MGGKYIFIWPGGPLSFPKQPALGHWWEWWWRCWVDVSAAKLQVPQFWNVAIAQPCISAILAHFIGTNYSKIYPIYEDIWRFFKHNFQTGNSVCT